MDTDFASLQRELSGRSDVDLAEDVDEVDDPYAALAAQYDEDDGDEDDERR